MSRPVTLYTTRLTLRPFCTGDVGAAQVYRNDPEFAKFLPHIPQPFTLRDAETFVATNISEPWTRSPTFAVVFDGVLIGTVNVEVDPERPSAMIGYAIGRRWWGRGIATEAATAAIQWAIDAFALKRVWASTDGRNVRSQRVLEKLGMRATHTRIRGQTNRSGAPLTEVFYTLNVRYGAG